MQNGFLLLSEVVAAGGGGEAYFSTYYDFMQENRMFKNVAGKIALFAFNTTTNAAVTGDAANITAYVSKDHGAVTVLADTTATEKDATNAKGWYLFDVAQGEANADDLQFTGKSSTANVAIVARTFRTDPNRFSDLVIASDGVLDANAVKHLGTAYNTPSIAGVPEVDLTHLNGVAQSLLDLKDFADDGYDPVTNKIQGLVLADAVTLLNGLAANIITAASTHADFVSEVQSGLATAAALATAQSSLDAIVGYLDTEVAAIKAKTDSLPSDPADASVVSAEITAAQVAVLLKVKKYFQLVTRKDSAIATDNATELTELNASGGSGAGTFSNITDSEEALKDDQMTSGELENSVWNANRASHVTAGTFGEYVLADATKINGSSPAAVSLSNGALSSMSATVDTAFFTSTTTAFEILGTIANPAGLVGRVVIFYTGADIRTAVLISAATTQGTNTRLTVAAMPAAPADGDLAVIV